MANMKTGRVIVSTNQIDTSLTSVINLKADEVTSAINELNLVDASTNELRDFVNYN